jgi:NADH dehydrogenase FAD-containing subunit
VVAPGAFWYSGLATGMLGGAYLAALDRIDIQNLLGRDGRFIRDEVVELNAAASSLRLRDGSSLEFDAVSIDVGSEPPPIPGAGRDCYDVKPIRRLYELRGELERRFETFPEQITQVAIAGGGITAFELAANVEQLVKRCGGRANIAVYPGAEPLSQLPRPAADKLIRGLVNRGIDIRLGQRVDRIDDRHLALSNGHSATFDFLINATGLIPTRAVSSFGLPVDENGAMIVDGYLMSVAATGVFGGGDCIAFNGRALPRIGVYAIRQAPVLYHNLLATLAGTRLQRFQPQTKYLSIMNLGNGRGLAVRGSLWWQGRAAFWLKDWIDRRFLSEYQSADTH